MCYTLSVELRHFKFTDVLDCDYCFCVQQIFLRIGLRKTGHQRYRNCASCRFSSKVVVDDGKNKQQTKVFNHFYLKSNC